MNDDYLWDRTGEADPEIQQLEETLGTLRYQPQPLAIPRQLQIGRRRSLFSSLAIAAAIALMFVWAGWWMFLNSLRPYDSAASRPTPTAAISTPSSPRSSQKAESGDDKALKSSDDEKKAQRRPRRVTSPTLARNSTGGRVLVVKESEVTASERTEAQAAKAQLLLALRVASSKLSLAQKRAQGSYPGNMIRNQHKVG